jgi:hypothetical protein
MILSVAIMAMTPARDWFEPKRRSNLGIILRHCRTSPVEDWRGAPFCPAIHSEPRFNMGNRVIGERKRRRSSNGYARW